MLILYPLTGPVTSYLQVFCFCEAATPDNGLYPLLAHSTVYGVSIQTQMQICRLLVNINHICVVLAHDCRSIRKLAE